jgi:hypothetical protein
MKKTVKNIILLLTLLVIVITGQSVVFETKANPKFPGSEITFYSPQDSVNYASDFHLLNFSIWVINDYNNGTRQAWYNLDGKGETPVSIVCEAVGSAIGYPWSEFWGVADLPPLSVGVHNIRVSIVYDFGDFVLRDSSSVSFQVENSTILKPSVPEFILSLHPVILGDNETRVDLTIKNQPFDSNDVHHYSFCYNVRIRTDGENWTDLYDAEDGYPLQSNSVYTVLSYVLGESAYYPSSDYPLSPSMKVGILPTEGQVDFQVEAMIGYRDRGVYANGVMPYVFKGEKSGWSDTQTVTIPASTSEPSANPTWESWQLEGIVGVIVVTVLTVAILLGRWKKHNQTSPKA